MTYIISPKSSCVYLQCILCLCFHQTSGYTLKVVAEDNGVPPLSSTAIINIDISDVNDNPPLFSQANYSLIIQVRGGGSRECRLLIRVKKIDQEGERDDGAAGGIAADTERD